MLPMNLPKKDPAPSRTKYRLERLWLRPIVQKSVRLYLPALAVGLGIALFVMDDKVQGFVSGKVSSVTEGLAARPELQVVEAKITGASEGLSARVKDLAGLELPISALKIDLSQLQKRISGLEPVLNASVRISENGVLEVSIHEREPIIVWRNAEGLLLIDKTGARVDKISDRAAHSDLPLIAGTGANRVVDEALDLLRIAKPISERVRGLVRIGERRWDLVMDRGLVIRLPEDAAASALARVMALNDVDSLLDRDIVVVDMRDKRRPLLRLTDPALEALRKPLLFKPEGEEV